MGALQAVNFEVCVENEFGTDFATKELQNTDILIEFSNGRLMKSLIVKPDGDMSVCG